MFYATQEATDFILTSDTRETDESVMDAIASHADSLTDAEHTWSTGLVDFSEEGVSNFLETATNNYRSDPADLQWGSYTLADVVRTAFPEWQFGTLEA